MPGRGSPGSQHKPLRAATRREALPVRHTTTITTTSSDGPTYSPDLDGEPDPGEVVWAWVAYDDDPAQGKDRPVLLLGERDGQWLGLMLSSQDHDVDAEDEASYGRFWMDVGSGGWDSEGRPSQVRLDRLLVLPREVIRREGAALPQEVFEAVVAAAREHHALD